MGRVIDLVEPFQRFLPDVRKAPEGTVNGYQKMMWTSLALLVFLVCRQIPIYGVNVDNTPDPFYWMRVIMASERGSLMELGLSPIISAGMIMQLLQGAQILDINPESRSDQQLVQAANKMLGLLMTVGQALVYVLSGMYGPVETIGMFNAMLIVLQLTFVGGVVILLDQLLQRGWGFSSGISLFIAANTSESILWKVFSPITQNGPRGTEFYGALTALVHFVISRENKLVALSNAFFRDELPNVSNMLATVLIFSVVIYLQGMHVNVTVQDVSGQTRPHKIKLFYTSSIPVILQASLVSNLYFLSKILYSKYPTNFLVGLFGTWSDVTGGARSRPTGGFAFYMSPPLDMADIMDNKFRALFYVCFILISSGLFSLLWVEISGTSATKVARQLKKARLSLKSHHDTRDAAPLRRTLDKLIPTAAMLGGMCIGGLMVLADFLNALGSGTGIMITVTIIYGIYEEMAKEQSKGNFSMNLW